jgi:hypothetical protein
LATRALAADYEAGGSVARGTDISAHEQPRA